MTIIDVTPYALILAGIVIVVFAIWWVRGISKILKEEDEQK